MMRVIRQSTPSRSPPTLTILSLLLCLDIPGSQAVRHPVSAFYGSPSHHRPTTTTTLRRKSNDFPAFPSARNQTRDKTTTIATTLKANPFESMKTWNDGKTIAIERCVLPLDASLHKGSSGRVGVLGGSARYTGAPYYAAMASLQAGADLAFVFCAQEATLPIKSYSPELMVAPVYSASDFDPVVKEYYDLAEKEDSISVEDFLEQHDTAQRLVDDMVNEIGDMLPKLHCLVVGPGLGRCPLVMKAVARVLELARSQQLHLVLDADALYMMSLPVYRSSLKGYDRLVLTPNVVEYQRLFPKSEDNNGETMEDASDEELAAATIVRKGAEDRIIVDQRQVMSCGEEGGLKRSGGIGDVLAGTLGTFTSWHAILLDREAVSTEDLPLSCWTACCAVKRATKRAFDDKRRAMTAPDVLHHLGQALDEMTRED